MVNNLIYTKLWRTSAAGQKSLTYLQNLSGKGGKSSINKEGNETPMFLETLPNPKQTIQQDQIDHS